MNDDSVTNNFGEESKFHRRADADASVISGGAIPLLLLMAITLFSDKNAMSQSSQQFTSTIAELQNMLDSLKTTLTALEQASNSWSNFETRYR